MVFTDCLFFFFKAELQLSDLIDLLELKTIGHPSQFMNIRMIESEATI